MQVNNFQSSPEHSNSSLPASDICKWNSKWQHKNPVTFIQAHLLHSIVSHLKWSITETPAFFFYVDKSEPVTGAFNHSWT